MRESGSDKEVYELQDSSGDVLEADSVDRQQTDRYRRVYDAKMERKEQRFKLLNLYLYFHCLNVSYLHLCSIFKTPKAKRYFQVCR